MNSSGAPGTKALLLRPEGFFDLLVLSFVYGLEP